MILSRLAPTALAMSTLLSSGTPRVFSYTLSRAGRQRHAPSSATPLFTSVATNEKPADAPADPTPEVLGKFPHGRTISNKDEVFPEIDKALGVSKPPDIEVILTDHMTNLNNWVSKFLHLKLMRFGHLAIRYTTSDGQQHVMNIMGNFTDPDATLINFFEPSDYFYGTDPKIAQQGGVYSRPFVGVRIENVAPGATDALHAYYQAVSKASEVGAEAEGNHAATGSTTHDVGGAPGSAKRGAARFQLVEVQFSRIARYIPAPFGRFLFGTADWIRGQDGKRRAAMLKASQAVNDFVQKQDERLTDRKITDMIQDTEENIMDVRRTIYQSGNCAQWTSGGLDFTGLIRRARLFPKAVLMDLFEDEYLSNRQPNNVHVVYYDEVEDAPQIYKGFKCIKSAMVHPLYWIRNHYYDNMKDFASVVVHVPTGTDRALVNAQTPKKVPQRWLQYISLGSIYLPAAVMAGLVAHIGPLGPTSAAVWLFANWWLY